MNITKELSESLFAACKAAGIYNPRYIAQDKDEPYVWHYDLMPDTEESGVWAVDNGNAIKIHHPPYADDWQDSLLEWVEPQEEPLASVLARHPECFTIETERNDEGEVTAHFIRNHRNEITEMIRPDHIADTSKKVDDACKIAYHAHLEKGDGLCWSRAGDYRQGWQDALAWKGGDDD